MAKNIHKEPFSEETITKLEIFETYFREWLPVFIHNPKVSHLNVCDFFAGTGKDINGIQGSPLRILKVIEEYRGDIFKQNKKIQLLFNELQKQKFDNLQENVNSELGRLSFGENLNVDYYQRDFRELFLEKKESLKNEANLIFLDQNGIKQVSQEIFDALDSFQMTDFMFFIASSFFSRFGQTAAFQEYFPDLKTNAIKDMPYADIHRVVVDYYRGKLPKSSKSKLYPFTIKKDKNIYGLVFGTKHVLGAEKFLRITWDKNKINGEANFDIDEDVTKQHGDLFPETKPKTKIEKFHDDMKGFLIEKGTATNRDLYDYALNNGFLPAHVTDLLRMMKQDRKLKYQGHPRVSYDKCYKTPEKVVFETVK